jgi:hypothetical protein
LINNFLTSIFTEIYTEAVKAGYMTTLVNEASSASAFLGQIHLWRIFSDYPQRLSPMRKYQGRVLLILFRSYSLKISYWFLE